MIELLDLEGIGPVRAEALRAMGINSLRDLLYTLPVRYEDHSTITPCNTKTPGMILVCGAFREDLKASYFHGISRVQGTIYDSSGKLPICWYNEPWISKQIEPNQTVRLYGQLSIKNGRRILQNPKISMETGWIPVYKSFQHFPAKSFRKLVAEALDHLEDCCPETIPHAFRIQNRLCELNFAIRQAHYPSSMENLGIARRRLAYEQILIYLLYVSSIGKKRQTSHAFQITDEQIDTFWSSLPFHPTKAQEKVLLEISTDMRKPVSMARLVQGDVGSGKTAVAFGAIYLAVSAGFQVAMMAPTEILAAQHFDAARKILEPLGVRCRLLTGSTKKKERQSILNEMQDGTCHALFGTHALISQDVIYHQLGLVITDEQHRFGVRQRNLLHEKGVTSDHISPHVLVLSATPIPRTLALILFGDLDISIIDELPAGRIPVKTRIVPENKRDGLYDFLRKQAEKGRQAYIVCPAVEESENSGNLRNAKTMYEDLKNGALSDLKIAITWGGQKSDEKKQVLQDFNDGKYDILIATTVIEVGINNPNATIMIIENAERFGLSQLHQLRGRVGRGVEESWCFLLSELTEKTQVLCSTNDGFLISQKDLELRGPGDLTGIRQSGDVFGNLLFGGDAKLIEEVSKAVQELYNSPEQKQILHELSEYALACFSKSGRSISLN